MCSASRPTCWRPWKRCATLAPAHNPPYITAMRLLSERLPEIPLVAAFETGFHQTSPARYKQYAIPYEWAEKHQVQRWGFHGASHRYIAGAPPSCLAGRICGSFPAIWADRIRYAPFATAKAWPAHGNEPAIGLAPE